MRNTRIQIIVAAFATLALTVTTQAQQAPAQQSADQSSSAQAQSSVTQMTMTPVNATSATPASAQTNATTAKPTAKLAADTNTNATANSSNLHLRLPEKPGRQDELKQLASTFNRMLDRIEAAIETQNLFIGNASHQIKNPLTAIIGEVETAMLKERSPAEYRHSLKIIGEEADRLSALAKQLVRMSYPDAGEGQIAEWRFDELLLDLVEEVKELYPQANMSIEFSSLPPDPEKLLYRGYYNLIRIAIGNLLENAIKFSNNTTVKLKLLFTDKHLIVSISDNGIGIPEEAQAHIFTPFYRAENAKGFPGYGVGLALADKVVKMHDGRLSLSSSAENGTIFTLLLPF